MHLIGITGLAGSGKDTAAHQIREMLRDDGQQAALCWLIAIAGFIVQVL